MYARAPVVNNHVFLVTRDRSKRKFERTASRKSVRAIIVVAWASLYRNIRLCWWFKSRLRRGRNPQRGMERSRGISPGFINIQVRCALSHCSKTLNSNERSFVRSRTVLTLGRTVGEQNLKGISIQGCTVPPYTTDHVH